MTKSKKSNVRKIYKKKSKIKENDSKNILVTGFLTINRKKNFGFVIPESSKIFPHDIFIPQRLLNGAIDGDLVEVKVILDKKYPEDAVRWKGRIEKVLKRNRKTFVGIVNALIDTRYVEAHVPALGQEKCIPVKVLEDYSGTIGDRIVIENISWSKQQPKTREPATMIEFLGNINLAATDRIVIEKDFQLTEVFSPEAEKEALLFSSKHIDKALKNREDLRSLLCFTIDSKTAKDFDDAVSLSVNAKQEYVLGVHIADVSHYVTKNSALNAEAMSRCNSVYFPGHVIPMLPHTLSSNLCSLKPNVNRLAISVFMTLNREGILQSYEIKKSVIKSKYRMTYDQVNAIIENNASHPISDNILLMVELSKKLQNLKKQRGCFQFAVPTVGLKFNDQDEPYDIFYNVQTDAHKLIEEFMLQANETIAKHAFIQGLALPYRIHEQPDPVQLEAFKEFVISLGLSLKYCPHDTNVPDYQSLLEETEKHIFGYLIHSNFIKSMRMASYSTENKGHYGLHLEYYTHFTSPIRRYIDLCLHRLLFDSEKISEEDLDVIVKQCSQKERLSNQVEHSFDKIKKMRFFLKMYKENPQKIYSGRIVSVKPEGIHFCLPEFFYEDVLVSANSRYSGKNKNVTEKRSFSLKPGMEISVIMQSVNLIFLTIKWKLHVSAPKQNRYKKKNKFFKNQKKHDSES